MTHLDDKTRARIGKLLALAKRGVGGEQDTASRALAAMLARHGLTMADVDSETVELQRVRLTTADAMEGKIALHVVFQFGRMVDSYFEPGSGRKSYVEVELTRAEAARVCVAWEVYRKAFRAERKAIMDAMALAFIDKHGLYAPKSAESTDPREFTQADLERAQRAKAMARTMSTVDRPLPRLAGV